MPTPKQRAAALTKELEAIDAARDALGPIFIPPIFEGLECGDDYVNALHVAHKAAHRALEKLAAHKRWCHDVLVVRSDSSFNAKRNHVQFWRGLADVWRKLPASKKRQHKHLQAFLWACSVPLFPKATTNTALVAFTNRIFSQTSV